MTCLEKITAAQKGLEGTDAFMAGEQLKEICRTPPARSWWPRIWT